MLNEAATGRFQIINRLGMHARAASKLVRLASSFPCDIMISSDEVEAVTAKSVMGMLLLCGSTGTWLNVVAQGEQAQAAVDAIGRLIADRFGESE
jgi:phosphocarrier protein HPr